MNTTATKPAKAPKAKAEKGEKGKRTKPAPKETYVGATPRNEEGLLTGVPTDFDAKKHAKLKKKDFADESHFWEMRAAQLQKMADKAKQMVTECKSTSGLSGEKKKGAKALVKRLVRLEELARDLDADDVDVDKLLMESGLGHLVGKLVKPKPDAGASAEPGDEAVAASE